MLKAGLLRSAVFWLCFGSASPVGAQFAGWSPLRQLSTDGYKPGTATMVSDPYGNLHVFWTETPADGPGGRAVIQHARFDGSTWGPAADIYATTGGLPTSLSAAVDTEGRVLLAWTANPIAGPVVVQHAQAHDADSAGDWSEPFVYSRAAAEVRILPDRESSLHLVYSARSEVGVYHARSDDDGRSWSTPVRLDSRTPEGFVPTMLQSVMDKTGVLHAVWVQTEPAVSYVGVTVEYAQSRDGGDTWTSPYTVDLVRPGDDEDRLMLPNPNLAVVGNEVHILWAADKVRRHHSVSYDGGTTWHTRQFITGELHGMSRGDGVAVDSAGRLHLIAALRYPGGLYHLVWNGRWSEPRRILSGEQAKVNPHDIRLAARGGSDLVVTLIDFPDGPQFVMYRALDDVLADPTKPTPEEASTGISTSDSTPIPRGLQVPEETGVLEPRSGVDASNSSQLAGGGQSGLLLAAGLVPAVVLVLAVLLLQLRRN